MKDRFHRHYPAEGWPLYWLLFVSKSSALLGERLPDGWLWQQARMVALASTASFIMIRMSAEVSLIPP